MSVPNSMNRAIRVFPVPDTALKRILPGVERRTALIITKREGIVAWMSWGSSVYILKNVAGASSMMMPIGMTKR